MKAILLVLLVMLSAPALAQTGIFYDETLRGEGITVFESETLGGQIVRTFYFYTYWEDQDSLLTTQRWFVASDLIQSKDGEVLLEGDSVGKLNITQGLDYPTCIPSSEPFEEGVRDCAEVISIGTYILRPVEGGFEMWVKVPEEHEGDPAWETDPLFNNRFMFTTPLLGEIR